MQQTRMRIMKLNDKGPPLYYQIEKYMREKILSNEWPVGTQIPTETELMELFSVSRATLRQAVGNLCNEGLLERLQGRGTFVKKIYAVKGEVEISPNTA